jgi:hypothetical protein
MKDVCWYTSACLRGRVCACACPRVRASGCVYVCVSVCAYEYVFETMYACPDILVYN